MGTAILFVDDEENILNGLKRSTRSMRNEWDMAFVTSGAEGLDFLGQSPVDIVVSDLRMPNMDGAEFLDQARKLAPSTIRFVLSGHADLDMAARSVKSAHQFLTKPCNAADLKKKIDNAIRIRTELDNPILHDLAAAVAPLPSIPTVYSTLVAQLSDPKSNLDNIAETVSKDISMSSSILKIANSSFFGIASSVQSIQKATIMLGVEVIKNLVLANEVFKSSNNKKLDHSVAKLSDRSLLRSAITLRVVRQLSDSECARDQAMAASVLQDLGQLVLLKHDHDTYAPFYDITMPLEQTVKAHKETFGYTSQELSAYILKLWGLPDQIIEAVNSSTWPPTNLPALCVSCSNALLERHDLGTEIDPDQLKLFEQSGLQKTDLDKIADRVFQDDS